MVKYLRAANVKDGELDLNDVKAMNFSPEEQKLFQLLPGDVLITEGSGSLSTVGAAAVWRGQPNETMCFQNTVLRMRPRSDVSDGRFLGWWARSAYGSGAFASLAGGANIYHLGAERVRTMRIDLPPLGVQRRIADFLDAETARIDHMVALQQAVRERLAERHAAELNLAIDELVDQVKSIPLRRFIVEVDQGSSPQCDAAPAEDGEWGVLKVSCLRPGIFLPNENKRLPESSLPLISPRHEVREGDLLITRANTPELVGSTVVVPAVRPKLLLSDKIFRVRLSAALDPGYVAVIARGARVRSICAGSSFRASQSMANLRFEDVKTWPIPVIEWDEQARLVARIQISQLRTEIIRNKIEQQLELLDERRTALITAAVAGEFDVSSASGRRVV